MCLLIIALFLLDFVFLLDRHRFYCSFITELACSRCISVVVFDFLFGYANKMDNLVFVAC